MDMHTIVDKITSGGIGQHSSPSKGGIQPGFGGLIEFPEHNDVLSGRGGRINNHPGNLYYRTLVNKYKHSYLDKHTKKLDKVKIANEIVVLIRNTNPPGRFLKQDTEGWKEIGDEKAKKKAGQAMREKATETRREMEEGKVIPQVVNSGVGAPVNVLSSPMPDSPGYANLYPVNMPIVSPPMATPIRVGSNSGSEVVAAYPGGYPQAGPISYDANNFQSPSARMEYAPYNQSVQMLSGLPTQQLNGTTSQDSPYRPYSDIGKISQSTTPKGRQAQTKGKIQENHVHDPSKDNFVIQKSEFKAQTKTQDILGADGVSFNRTFHTLRDSDVKSEISSLDRRSLISNKTSISSNKTSISSGTTFKSSIRGSPNTTGLIDSDPDDLSQREKYRQSMQFKSAEASDSETENCKKYQSNVMKNENDLSYLPSQLTGRGAPTPRMEISLKMSEISMLRASSASTGLIDSDPDDSSQREKYRQSMQFKSAETSDSEAENRKKYQSNVMKNENDLSYLPSQLTDRDAHTPSIETSLKMSEISMLRTSSASNRKECSISDDDIMNLVGDSVPDLNRPELTLSDAQAVTADWNSTAATTGRRSSSSSSDLKSNRERLKSENSSDAMSFRLDKGKAEYSSSDAMSFRLDKTKEENISSDDMSLVSRNSMKSNTSVWLSSFKGMQGLPPAGERERLFSDFSQRSMLSEMSSDMLALDLAGGEIPPFFDEPSSPVSPTFP